MHTPVTAALAATALLTLGQPAFAQTQAADAPGTVVRAGDDALTCPQMADEAATISASMGEEGPGLLGRVTGVARAGASMLVPGAGVALAGADALTSSRRDKKEAEADAKRDRWNYLNGLFAGRGCGETAVQATSGPAGQARPAQTSAQPAVATAPPRPQQRRPPP
ncbi:hypothetical protein [Brevundimonas goettingensis]|uniref:Uncharacterized protein n=1 Tax=Brevundimonas goettingensis TaxID=2774190 RepID=A0A975GUI7_9CAUL|nr:hypothetical protein [Brevundimonas goettingensis]QTC90147.1 hypothetical protein IFJ75_12740 [Brevundimonas goettingensis]